MREYLGEPVQPIQHRGWQAFCFDKDQVATNNAHLRWQRAGDCFVLFLPGWRQCSRVFLRFIIRYAAPNSHEVAGACCIAHESFEFREGHSPNTGQKCPLVGMRIEVGIQENTMGVSVRHVLQRRGDEVAEAVLGPCPGSERIGRRSRGQADGDAPSCASEWLYQACEQDLQATGKKIQT